MELIENLTKQLGVSETQAQGGAGLILKQAREKLGGEDFVKVSSAIPGIEGLISAAPAGGGGMLSGLGKTLGGAGGLAGLAGGFSQLGLDSSMIGKFLPVILSFVQSKGGDGVKSILEKALR